MGLLCLFPFFTQAQDLLVTSEGDSISCKITSIENGTVHFTLDRNGQTVQTLMPPQKVSTFEEGFYTKKNQKPALSVPRQRPWRLGISSGYGRRLSKTHESLAGTSYARGLKNGYHITLEGQYFFPSETGIGLVYSSFHAKSESQSLMDDITISFLGPTLYAKMPSGNNNSFLLGGSFGYLSYKDQAYSHSNGDFTLKGATLGAMLDATYDIGLSENLALGLGLSVTSGVIEKITIEKGRNKQTIDLDAGNEEGLLRIDLKVGLSFYP
ncbi:autotransporter protein [Echinicola vietnamensis]|uniref:Putative autotransporter protein n=1 Tax=Echinicola vietnamensis (strain DSM 17526 / LMG 23754 / KMM 6221) TaxID=926556 RepID=L0G0P4_ECHVK|nr:autotransporter protein [Echinicola vietnamensis]AGA78878.1 putative autotransporter protein [Echinicola vietnamensis DSM 17526]